MDIVSSSATLKDDHYYLKLPLRNTIVSMPNNKPVAQQRAQHFLKRFPKDQSFYNEHKDLNGVLKRGYAEIVPQDELEPGSRKV